MVYRRYPTHQPPAELIDRYIAHTKYSAGKPPVSQFYENTASGIFIEGTVCWTDEPIAMPFLQLHVVFAKLLRVVPKLLGDAMPHRANFVDCRVGSVGNTADP